MTTGVPPEIPVSNRCPLTTVKPLSVIDGYGAEDSLESGRRLLATSSSIPSAARSMTPPSEPTIAGTRGTTADLVACVPVGVGDDVGPPVDPGWPVVGIYPNVVEVANVENPDVPVQLKLPETLQNDDIALGEVVIEVALKKGDNVDVGR